MTYIQLSPSNKFLEKAHNEGSEAVSPVVQIFGNGLKLAVTQEGDGKTFPHVGDLLTMHYTLRLAGDASGKVIDSSRS
eukprot:CAMPEP_0172764710 /NCGR_PEP_ID=MMETSP1074-20121228/177730_1 /TAXON_ID=2916 /ORGANISM="Ceratium fusus, Strain PA161109" /LENGTH=77 /DNA_ID=CAMNT_0013599515 /DNA_START=30 /DNA_END=259 /DNA_ORIENTATION=+